MRELLAKCPVNKVLLPEDSTAWLVTGFDQAREVMTDQRYSRALIFARAPGVRRFHEWSNAIFADWSRSRDEIAEAYVSMSRYMSELISQKRKAPEDDLISVLIDARDLLEPSLVPKHQWRPVTGVAPETPNNQWAAWGESRSWARATAVPPSGLRRGSRVTATRGSGGPRPRAVPAR
jgi:hypothetical protein